MTIGGNVLNEAGCHDLIVENPWPYNPDTGKLWATARRTKRTWTINYKY